ncbi:uncharacterized protein L201_003830 [Kwoniella dendrophila CBS 6074]|uniref:Transcription factor domain-containing protein n=1 Tax=Kwoniella dendrophila CBS 6074 TaxID=1295534 RepID=A0AAX4JU15_9TREE
MLIPTSGNHQRSLPDAEFTAFLNVLPSGPSVVTPTASMMNMHTNFTGQEVFNSFMQSAFPMTLNDSGLPDNLFSILASPSQFEHFQNSGLRAIETNPSSIQQTFDSPRDYREALNGKFPETLLSSISEEHLQLLHYYVNVQTSISVACDTTENPLQRFMIPLATGLPVGDILELDAAYWALLACAATHHANLLMSSGKSEERFRSQARKARNSAYKFLARDITIYQDIIPEKQLLYTACLDGNCLLLDRITTAFSDAVLTASTTKAFHDEREVFFLSMASVYQTWLEFNSLATNKPKSRIFWDVLQSSQRPQSDDFASIFGVSVEVCETCNQVLDIIRNYNNSQKYNDLRNSVDKMLQAEEISNDLLVKLENAVNERDVQVNGDLLKLRLKIGRILHYAALRVLLLTEVLGCSKLDGNVQRCVNYGVEILPAVKWGSETGTMMACLILASMAKYQHLAIFQTYADRTCWKGSSGHRALADGTRLFKEKPHSTWKDAVISLGCPMFA